MSRAETPTLLSLDRFAKVMGINPVHFNGAAGETLFPIGGACSDIWWQQTYMGADRVSREDLAQTIAGAEDDIARYLGYWPAPKWVSREMHMFPRTYRPEWFDYGLNVRGDRKSLKLNWGRFIAAGRRYAGLISQASTGAGTLVWSDPDGDGVNELATITLPTTLTSASRQQVKVYFDGHSEPEWEVRPLKSVDITAGVLAIEIDFWLLIDPAQQDPFPTSTAAQALNIGDPTIFVDTVDVYREYTDYSQHSVEFYWEPREVNFPCASCGGSGCTACSPTIQCGCLHVRDVMLGMAVPAPATWDVSSGGWVGASYSVCYAPDQVKVWYYAGEMSQGFLNGDSLDPLDHRFAEAIAWMTVARLERPFCNCGNLASLQKNLRAEYTRTDSGGPSFYITDKDVDNPFGTRKGELMAWHRLKSLAQRIPHVAVV